MKSESRRSGSLLPRSGNFARRPPRGSRRAELMMTCLATRPHWLLASLFRFQGAAARHRTAERPRPRTVPRAPSRHSPLPPPLPRGAGSAGASVSIHRKWFSGRTGDTTGCLGICKPGPRIPCDRRSLPAHGIERSEEEPQGQARQHLAKVGTPAENCHTLHAAERDVVGNFGVHARAGCSGPPWS